MTRLKVGGNRQKGAVAVVVAITVLLLVIIAGGVVDIGRAMYARQVLQNAADAASLAAGRDGVDAQASQADKETALAATAQALVNGRLMDLQDLVQVQPVTATYHPMVGLDPDSVTISLSGKVPAIFLNSVGIPEFNLNIESTSQFPQPGPIDLVLVLDATLSMNDPPASGGQSKIQTLREAARNLVNEIMAIEDEDIRIGIVPYSTYVNVGLPTPPAPPPSWILPIERNGSRCTYQFPNIPCKPPVTVDCYIDGILRRNACTTTDCSPKGRLTCTPSSTVYRWNGCVGARSVVPPNHPNDITLNTTTEYYLDKISDPTVAYPGISSFSAPAGCGTTLLPLTSTRQDVLDKIDQLLPLGETHIPAGLIWGWNVLAPGEPYDARTFNDLRAIGGRKAMVLMTDGINSLSPRLYDGAYAKNGDSSRLNRDWLDGTKTNQLTKDICTNIKNQANPDEEIELFTVLFDVAPGSVIEDILKECATGGATGNHFYAADDSASLIRAFGKITDRLKTLKLTK